MKFAISIGAAGYPWFTELNVCTAQAAFGIDTPIVISEDCSSTSPEAERIAAKRGCYYALNNPPLGHFQGDLQASLNALGLAQAEGADIAVKISQRFCVLDPEIPKLIAHNFALDPNLAIVCPGRPNPNWIRKGHQQFARFAILTDVMFMRTSAVLPERIKDLYVHQIKNGKNYHDSFVEIFWHRVCNEEFPGRHWLCPEITNQRGERHPKYLRRYQSSTTDYQRIADEYRIGKHVWDLRERANMTRNYDPRPRI